VTWGFGFRWFVSDLRSGWGMSGARPMSDRVPRAAAGEDVDGVVLIAEHQTAGRGRTGRVVDGYTQRLSGRTDKAPMRPRSPRYSAASPRAPSPPTSHFI
jgi:hypothetical protein